jgi:proteasome lid subunit RPN8/RPN11
LFESIYEEMVEHARSEYPNEACGILGGKGGKILRLYRMTNTEKSPATYFMDSREQFSVMRDLRERELDMLGIYHSHVATPARPSARDIEMAFYPDVLYLIISLEKASSPDVRGFFISGEIREETIEIERR